MVVKISITAEIDENNFEEIKKMEHHAEAITEAYPELDNIHVKVQPDNSFYVQAKPSSNASFSEEESNVIEHISNLSGDFKCYNNQISHKQSLILDNLLQELKEFRKNGITVEKIIETERELANTQTMIEQLQENEKRLLSEAAAKCDYCPR